MMPQGPTVSSNDEIDSESAHLVDFKLISNQLSYVAGSIRRHRPLVTSLFVAIVAATVSSLFLLPKTYRVETKVLAQRNLALALKGDNQGEIPSRAAVETVMRRDNLVAIIRQTDLLHEWYLHRAPLPHLKDLIVKAVGKQETEQETTEWMADVLEKRLIVWTPSEGIIQIAVEWPDPTMALRLVDAAEQNYLEARHATEITAIAEQVAILQSHATALRTDIDTAVDAIEKLRAERLAKPAATAVAPSAAPVNVPPAAVAPTPAPRHPTEPDPDLAQLKVTIEAKQRAINNLEEFRRNRLNDLNASLAEKRATYTDNHPAIIDLRQTIASLSTESPQVQALRADSERLQKEFDEKSATAAAESRPVPVLNMGGAVRAPPPLPGSIIRIEQEPADDRDPAMMYARTRLRDAMEKYSTLRAQIETAQIDFDTAEAAFKYRYSVIDPPLYPKKPDKPNVVLVVLAGLIGGLLVAIFAAVAVDVRRGRFVERWQVERALDLPTLAEIDLATLAEHKIE
jgi:uncharacterized protein involved in exopolysaccharide biosynthesis